MKQILIFLSLILLVSCRTLVITPIERGVIYNRFSGLDTTQVLEEGFHVIGLSKHITEMDIRVQKQDITLPCKLADGSIVTIEYSFIFKPNEEYLPHIFRDIGSEYVSISVVPRTRRVTKDALVRFYPSQLSDLIIEELMKEQIMTKELWKDYIIPLDVIISEISFESVIEEAKEHGVQSSAEKLKSTDPETRLAGIDELFKDGSSIAIRIILNHWYYEKDVDNRDYILKQVKGSYCP